MEGPVQRIVKQCVKNELPSYLVTQNYGPLQGKSWPNLKLFWILDANRNIKALKCHKLLANRTNE